MLRGWPPSTYQRCISLGEIGHKWSTDCFEMNPHEQLLLSRYYAHPHLQERSITVLSLSWQGPGWVEQTENMGSCEDDKDRNPGLQSSTIVPLVAS